MPTYTYETIPGDASATPTRFEVSQSITEDALTEHPESGQLVRRVISGGIELLLHNGDDRCCSSDSCCG